MAEEQWLTLGASKPPADALPEECMSRMQRLVQNLAGAVAKRGSQLILLLDEVQVRGLQACVDTAADGMLVVAYFCLLPASLSDSRSARPHCRPHL
jgi:hypothetical protein